MLVELWRQVCRRGGLADVHFDWPHSALLQLRRHLRWLSFVGTPLLVWSIGLEIQEREALWNSSLGRMLFLGLMGLTALVFYRILLSHESSFRLFVLQQSDRWLVSLHHVWCPLVAIAPLVFAITAAAGYYYTAQQLSLRLLYTAGLGLGVLILGGLLQRWVLVNRRKLAREQARQRRLQAPQVQVEPGVPAIEMPEETINLSVLSEQTRKLIRTGLVITAAITGWFIWKDILPAFEYIANAPLGMGTATWFDLVFAMLVLAITWVSVENIPGLLELAVLQRLPIDAGARYAVSTICRYILSAIGILLAGNRMGIHWENLQWLAAAMAVGLGFGLQEIFANFISGIILLFERPIRVGDIVTLGDKSGVVSKIRIRSTTILDWDRKEYIVPNKDLVTERLLNWTLSDQTNRIVISLGVAYGSDTNRACMLLIEAAREQPLILTDPAPVATFEGFGESTLNLVLRCFLPTLEHRTAVIHALHTNIDAKFREAGIEIASRQKEITLRAASSEWSVSMHDVKPGMAKGHGRGAA